MFALDISCPEESITLYLFIFLALTLFLLCLPRHYLSPRWYKCPVQGWGLNYHFFLSAFSTEFPVAYWKEKLPWTRLGENSLNHFFCQLWSLVPHSFRTWRFCLHWFETYTSAFKHWIWKEEFSIHKNNGLTLFILFCYIISTFFLLSEIYL